MPDHPHPPTEADYLSARAKLINSGIVGLTLAEQRHRQILDTLWAIAFSAGWAACERSQSVTRPSATSGGGS